MCKQLRFGCASVYLLGIAVASHAWAQDPKPKQDETKPPPRQDSKTQDPKAGDKAEAKDIIATLTESKDYATFVRLIDAAGMTATLKGKAAMTVLAPDDKAFDKVGKSTVDNWMKPENKETLKGIIQNHILNGKHEAAAIGKMKTARTMRGPVTITSTDGKTLIENATITKPDIKAGNSIIHGIDTVLMPKESPGEQKPPPAQGT